MINNPVLGNLGSTDPVNYTGSLISTAISAFFVIGIVVAFFMILWGALTWITSGSDKGKTEAAGSRITQAIVGLLLLFLVYAVINLVGCIFGLNLLEFQIGEFNIGLGDAPICN